MINLILACMWLLFGGWLLFLYYVNEIDRLPLHYFEIRTLMIGWLAMVLSAYNLVRWWSGRSADWQRQAFEQRGSRRVSHREKEPPNPDFDFTNQPPRSDPVDRQP